MYTPSTKCAREKLVRESYSHPIRHLATIDARGSKKHNKANELRDTIGTNKHSLKSIEDI